MATTTTNFGWDIPQSTDLVKDGATAIAALGQDIDTALVGLKGGTTGQILSKTSGTDLAYTWITNDVGDITAVTAGTGISGGGTSGAVTVTNSMATAITTAGDVIYGTGSGTFSRLGIGTAGQVLTVNGGATAPSWATAATGGMTSIASGSLSGSALSLSSISGSYKNLQLILRDVYTSSSAALSTRFNSDSTANAYNDQGVNLLNGTASAVGQRSTESTSGIWSALAAADNNNSIVIDIFDYANATTNKNITFFANYTSTSGSNVSVINCGWKNSAAINAISLTLSAGTFSGGTYVLYGVN
jgi:hypothetical protein